ncbi:hypothetical protein ACFQGT_05455 [Natrialbaceae archaeon GCM10025810]|uniref:DUF7471 family protein n=1 Tax=Halovalidus salilacus TaxID=3075124 RepID=UPI0036120B6F
MYPHATATVPSVADVAASGSAFASASVTGSGVGLERQPRWVLEGGLGAEYLNWPLATLLILSALGSVAVFALSFSALRRRRSLPYLLITAALGALVLRPVVGTGTVLGYVPMPLHHVISHSIDAVIAALLIAAIVAVGSLEPDDVATDGGPRDPPAGKPEDDARGGDRDDE